ncbi:MAG: hypothetical protein ABI873_09445 [Marmoricola sp.]
MRVARHSLSRPLRIAARVYGISWTTALVTPRCRFPSVWRLPAGQRHLRRHPLAQVTRRYAGGFLLRPLGGVKACSGECLRRRGCGLELLEGAETVDPLRVVDRLVEAGELADPFKR